MRRELPRLLHKRTGEIIAESHAGLDRAGSSQVALNGMIAEARRTLDSSKDLRRRIDAVLWPANRLPALR